MITPKIRYYEEMSRTKVWSLMVLLQEQLQIKCVGMCVCVFIEQLPHARQAVPDVRR